MAKFPCSAKEHTLNLTKPLSIYTWVGSSLKKLCSLTNSAIGALPVRISTTPSECVMTLIIYKYLWYVRNIIKGIVVDESSADMGSFRQQRAILFSPVLLFKYLCPIYGLIRASSLFKSLSYSSKTFRNSFWYITLVGFCAKGEKTVFMVGQTVDC